MSFSTASGPDEAPEPYLLNAAQAAEFLSIKPGTLRTWRSQGRGPACVMISSRAVRYRVEDLKAWADALLVGGDRR
ncbi:helix-turn-helix transcriptional regulator [Actinomyces marmotae]|uniref:helix-turn-helix transcriptional regulator n=1 Tax=Actinomyces marmotae TaxID=2737173 RepID=UPI00135AA0C9|nr:helix-turn-helix domain-containing protein [Actinomyces marmotae]